MHQAYPRLHMADGTSALESAFALSPAEGDGPPAVAIHEGGAPARDAEAAQSDSGLLTIGPDDLVTRGVERRLREVSAVARNRMQDRLDASSLARTPAKPAPPAVRLLRHGTAVMAAWGVLGSVLGWGALTLALRLAPPGHEAEAAKLVAGVERVQALSRGGSMDGADAARAVAQLRRQGAGNPYFGVLAEPLLEPADREQRIARLAREDRKRAIIVRVLAMAACGAVIATVLSAGGAISDRNLAAALPMGSVGAVAGLIGGVLAGLALDRLRAAALGAGDGFVPAPVRDALVGAATWALMGGFLGLAPGLVMCSARRLAIGAAGGLIGGLVGGAMVAAVASAAGSASIGELAGLAMLGVVAGVATGAIEDAAKTHWIRVIAGRIAGKQFILYRPETFLGSGPDCQIYLFQDRRIGRRHAVIRAVKGGYEVEDLPLGEETHVNDKPVARRRLQAGDRVRIGSTELLFQERPGVVAAGGMLDCLLGHVFHASNNPARADDGE